MNLSPVRIVKEELATPATPKHFLPTNVAKLLLPRGLGPLGQLDGDGSDMDVAG